MIFRKFISLIFLSFNTLAFSQTFKQEVAYAGVGFTYGFNGTIRTDWILYFRPDGTFAEDLEEKNWQTRIDGKYKIKGLNVILDYTDPTEQTDTLELDNNRIGGWYAGARMIRCKVPNKIPQGHYGYYGMSGSGGMGTGMAYVGTSFEDNFYFFDNGLFTRDFSSATTIIGRNVGGGTSKQDNNGGSYTIKNGLLTLNYNTGTTEKMSFFYDVNILIEEEAIAVFEGSIFFYNKIDKNYFKEKSVIAESKNSDIVKSKPLLEKELLKKIKTKHGGAKIDNLKTLKATVNISGIEFLILFDIEKKYIRLESKNPNFNYIEQLEGDSGWIYQNNSITKMPTSRVSEMQKTLVSGIFGLRSDILQKTKIIEQKSSGDDLEILVLDVNGMETGLIIDKSSNTIIGSFSVKNGQKEITYNSNYKVIDGLLLPFKEVTETNGQKIEITYKQIIANPKLTQKDWVKPD